MKSSKQIIRWALIFGATAMPTCVRKQVWLGWKEKWLWSLYYLPYTGSILHTKQLEGHHTLESSRPAFGGHFHTPCHRYSSRSIFLSNDKAINKWSDLECSPSSQETVAFQDGGLHIESGNEFPNGGNLEEPVPTGLFGRLWHLIRCEIIWWERERGSREEKKLTVSIKMSRGWLLHWQETHQADAQGGTFPWADMLLYSWSDQTPVGLEPA